MEGGEKVRVREGVEMLTRCDHVAISERDRGTSNIIHQ